MLINRDINAFLAKRMFGGKVLIVYGPRQAGKTTSITAFLAQDIFGGKVYGILREGGNYHCYNVVGDCVFDLTSEQFGDEKLCYENNPEQFHEVHWQKEEKHQRYNYLKAELLKKLEEI